MEEGLKDVAEGMVLTGPFFDKTIFLMPRNENHPVILMILSSLLLTGRGFFFSFVGKLRRKR